MKIPKWKELLKLAKQGNENAQYEVACIYEKGLQINKKTIVKPSPKKALDWFVKSHKNGNSNATVRYADYLSEGKYCFKNLRRAISLYKKEIKNGSYAAIVNLATTYCHEKKWKDAIQLYNQIRKDFKIINNELAYCHFYGLGIKQDKSKAMKLLKLIANNTSINRNSEYDVNNANYYIGLIYLEGEVVKQSIKRARKYFKLANIDNDHKNASELLLLIGN